jgi:galactokinase
MRYAASSASHFFAPGRVNLIGEHTDYAGGLVLPVALDLGVTVEIEPAQRIELVSEGFGHVDIGPRGEGNAVGWARYAAAVATELDLLGREPVGMRGEVRSTLPAGAGLASSAALEVGLALALCAVGRLELTDRELVQAARRAEQRAVGVPCGVLDQAASILGREGCAVMIETATFAHEYVPLPRTLELVVLDSGVRRRLEDSRYAERRAEVERGDPRRLRHVNSENERVREVVRALRREPPDLDQLGRLFRAGHDSLRDDFEVSTPELDALVDRAYAAGAVAARLTGGGFGGTVIALARRGDAAALIHRVRPAAAWVVTASHGARPLPHE